MARRYYVRRRAGPYDPDALRSLIDDGVVEPDDEISPDDGETWVPVRAAMALGPLAAPRSLPVASGAAAPDRTLVDQKPPLEIPEPDPGSSGLEPLPVPGTHRVGTPQRRAEPTPVPPSRPDSRAGSQPALALAPELSQSGVAELPPKSESAELTAPPTGRESSSAEWSSTDAKAFFAEGEELPEPPTTEDSLAYLDAPGRGRRRRMVATVGWLVAVVALGGAGFGAWTLIESSKLPPLPSERLAKRHGPGDEAPAGEEPPVSAVASADTAGAEPDSPGSAAPPESAGAGIDDATPPADTGLAPPAGEGGVAPPPGVAEPYAALVEEGNRKLRGFAFGPAIKKFKEALELHPSGAAAHAGLAEALIEIGKSKGAEEAALRALALDGTLASPHRTLALVFHERGKKVEACERYALYAAHPSANPKQAREAKANMADLRCKVPVP